MIKKQAHYRVTVYSNEDTVIITDPITCHFNISRGVLSDNNKATIQLYNLAPSTREKIFQDAFTIDYNKFKYVHVEAGYDNTMSLVFKGRILQAYSHKAGGQTDVITEIQAMALDIFDCQSSYTFKAGTTKREALQTMVLDMPNVQLANLGSLDGVFQTDTTFDGNTMENLSKLTGGNIFVDNGNINCIMANEVIDVPVPVISDDSCLLETPMRRDANLEVKMLFQPDLIVGQLLEIKSNVSPNFNGQFKVIGFTHDCTISASEGGSRITSVNLWIGPFLPNASITETGSPTGGAAPASGFNKVKNEEVLPVDGNTQYDWSNPLVKMILRSNYGWRIHPIQKTRKFHDGIDLVADPNTPVYAVADGTVSVAGWIKGYGNYIQIEHQNQLSSFYGHLNYIGVSKGQKVTKRQCIAKSGNTGDSTGPHLHFGVKKNGSSDNPLKYIKLS